jgi:hypothetical protein
MSASTAQAAANARTGGITDNAASNQTHWAKHQSTGAGAQQPVNGTLIGPSFGADENQPESERDSNGFLDHPDPPVGARQPMEMVKIRQGSSGEIGHHGIQHRKAF